VNTSLESKDLVLSLMVKKIKYFDEAKTILDNNKGKNDFSSCFKRSKENSIAFLLTKKEN
jgi:regulator of sigma E protease